MKFHKPVYVVGGAHTKFIGKFNPDFIWKKHPDFGKKENPSTLDYICNVTNKVIDDYDINAELIEKGFVGNFAGELFDNQAHLGAALAGAHKDLKYKPFMRVEGACASGGLAVVNAIDSILAGNDVILAMGAEVQTTESAKVGADFLARASHYKRQREIDEFTFPCLFARRIKAYLNEGGGSWDELNRVSYKAYSNGNKNPYAHMTKVKQTLENISEPSKYNPLFIENPEYHDYLKVSDCSQVSDGASAIIVCSEEGLAKLGKKKSDAIEILGYSHTVSSIFEDNNPLELTNTKRCADNLFRELNLKPFDFQIAELHDCFTIAEILMLEALGFAEQGKAKELVLAGETESTGKIPVNTGGGLISFGHPVGATGVKQIFEIFRQMKGLCGDYQLQNKPEMGITSNLGGDDLTSVIMAFKAL